MPSVLLSVPDLSCGNCERHVRAALHGLAGVGACSVDLAHKQVRLEVADAAALAAAQQRLAAEDYPASVLTGL